MQSLSDIMGNKDFDVPPEIAEIKAYVARYFTTNVGVVIQEHSIVITTHSAALAGSLRPHLHRLTKQLKTDKKLIIRIG